MALADGSPILLVIDDDDDVRETVQLFLEREGFRVITAENGKAALEQLAGGLRPHLIILDLVMPVMTGWQFWEAQQADLQLREIPVVILTAIGPTADVEGVTCLAKPVDCAELLRKVRAGMRRRTLP